MPISLASEAATGDSETLQEGEAKRRLVFCPVSNSCDDIWIYWKVWVDLVLNQVENCWDNTATAPAAGRGASYLDLSHAPGQRHEHRFLQICHYIHIYPHLMCWCWLRLCHAVSAGVDGSQCSVKAWPLNHDSVVTLRPLVTTQWSPQCLCPEAFLSIRHTLQLFESFWNPVKEAGKIGQSQSKKKSKHMAKLSKSRQQWAVMALGRSWWCHRKEGMRNASGCVPLWSLAPAGEEEERGLASAKHCQASIENTISYPLPSHTPATTASSSSVQIWRKIKFWILNSDLHVHFASDVRLCILSVMCECIMTPSILLE